MSLQDKKNKYMCNYCRQIIKADNHNQAILLHIALFADKCELAASIEEPLYYLVSEINRCKDE